MNRIDSLFAQDLRLSESLSMGTDDGSDIYFAVHEAREDDKIKLFDNASNKAEKELENDQMNDEFAEFLMDEI